jgi:hypothetical protein
MKHECYGELRDWPRDQCGICGGREEALRKEYQEMKIQLDKVRAEVARWKSLAKLAQEHSCEACGAEGPFDDIGYDDGNCDGCATADVVRALKENT